MAKILLIDDNPEIEVYLVKLLRHLGHEVDVAADGAAAAVKADQPGLDLIVTDLNLPGEPSGMDLVRMIRQKYPDRPLVVVSGFPTPERLKECEELGVKDFLTKPFEVSFLKKVVERLLGSMPA